MEGQDGRPPQEQVKQMLTPKGAGNERIQQQKSFRGRPCRRKGDKSRLSQTPSKSNGKNRPSIFCPAEIVGTPFSGGSFDAESTPSRKTLITVPRRERSLLFSNEP